MLEQFSANFLDGICSSLFCCVFFSVVCGSVNCVPLLWLLPILNCYCLWLVRSVGLSQVDVRKATPKVEQDGSGRGGRGGFNNQRGGPTRGRGDY